MRTGTATRIYPEGDPFRDARGEMRLYKLDPPISEPDWEDEDVINQHEYVVVSAVVACIGGAETYIFPADENGEITDWGELKGSFQGALDHELALANAGYTVVE